MADADDAVFAGGASSRAGTASGGARNLPTGGQSSVGGTFSASGTFSVGGFPVAVAGMGMGGFVGMGGFPDCNLSVGDCRLDNELQCGKAPQVCAGELTAHQLFGDSEAFVTDLAVSPAGRLVLAGRFTGTLDFGGGSQPLTSVEPQNGDGFVASFAADGTAQWAYAAQGLGSDEITGVRFAPNGDVVAQGQSPLDVFALRLDTAGELLWSTTSVGPDVDTGRVGIDNDGNIVLAGTYVGSLALGGSQLSRTRRAGYLVKLDAQGDLLWAADTIPVDWISSSSRGLAVDDEDNIVVIGHGVHSDGASGAFIQKVTSNADAFVATVLPSVLSLTSVTVDRNMRVVVAGSFLGGLMYGGELHLTASGSDVWTAQYSRAGELNWQRVFGGGATGASALGVAVDPFGNVVLTGNALTLDVPGVDSKPPGALYVLKLRPDGSKVWARSFDHHSDHSALGIGNRNHIWLAGSYGVEQPGQYAFLLELLP